MKRLLFIIILFGTTSLYAGSITGIVPETGLAFSPEIVVVKLKAGVEIDAIEQLNRQFNVKKITPLFRKVKDESFGLSRIYKIVLAPDIDVEMAVNRYNQSSSVEYAEPDYIVQACTTIPNDPSFPQQWGLNQANDCDIDASESWDIEKGSTTVIIAISDTGVDYNHQDLNANIWRNSGEIQGNGIDDDKNGYIDDYYGWDFAYDDNNPSDVYGHGSHCAGISGAVTNNGIGVAGSAWYCKIMVVKGLGDDGRGYDSDCAQTIVYAADNGAKVISMSWGDSSPIYVLEDALKYAWNKGCLLCAAAGNNASTAPFYPGGYTTENGYTDINIIGVGASDQNDIKASFSNYGSWITLFAPGVGILSTLPNNRYASWSGTSMATPFASGVGSLLFAHWPDWINAQIRERIKSTVDYVGLPYNKGRLNAYKSLYESPPPLQITTTSLPSGQFDMAYIGTLTAIGGVPPYIWSITEGSNLPSGLILGSSTGIISGTPTITGTATFTAQVRDSVGSTNTKTLTLYIADAPPAPHGIITKTVTTQEVIAGDTIIYTITYQNNGSVTLSCPKVYDYLPFEVTFATSTPVCSSSQGNQYIWELPSLIPFECGSITIVAKVGTETEPYTYLENKAELWECGAILLGSATIKVYVGTPTYYIKGKVVVNSPGRESGVAGVKVYLITKAPWAIYKVYVTGPDGKYEFTDILEGNYYVVPRKHNWEFTPVYRAYSVLNSNQDNQDYVGSRKGVEGYIDF